MYLFSFLFIASKVLQIQTVDISLTRWGILHFGVGKMAPIHVYFYFLSVLFNTVNKQSSNIWEQHLQIKIVFMKRLRAD
jgi:hypothetical protein